MKINGNLIMTKSFKDGSIEKTMDHNTLSTLFEKIIMAAGVGQIISSNPAEEIGQSFINCKQRYSDGTYSATSSSYNNLMTIYLCNLTTEEQQALNKDIKKNPILTADAEVDDTKVIGWATCSYLGGQEKEGKLKEINPSVGIDSSKYGISWHWTYGKMNGTFNTVIIGTNVFTEPYTSMSISRGLDFYNSVLGGSSPDGYYLINDVQTVDGQILTGKNEILLGDDSSNSKARKVLNLVTGEVIDLEQSDARYDTTLFNVAQYYLGDGRLAVNTNNTTTRVYTIENKNITSYTNYSAHGFIVHNNMFYTYEPTSSTSTMQAYFRAYDLETLTRQSSGDITFTLNSYFVRPDYWTVSNFGDKFVFLKTSEGDGFIFTDISNPMGSFDGGVSTNAGSSIYIGDDNQFRYLAVNNSNIYNRGNTTFRVYNNAGSQVSVYKVGIKMLDDTMYGQVMSYAILDNPITMTNGNTLDFDYYYSI